MKVIANSRDRLRRPSAQQGFALIMTLVFLIVLTLMVLGVVNTTTLEEKIGRNFRDTDVALAAAEAGLRDAELLIAGTYRWRPNPLTYDQFNSTCTDALCDSTAAQSWQPVDQLDFFAESGTGSKSRVIGTTTGSPTIPGLANQPRYMIEIVGTSLQGESDRQNSASDKQYAYRITVQAHGRLGASKVVLQEIYRSPPPP